MAQSSQISLLDEKFHWKNYEKKFPTIRFIIVIIELILFALFLMIRFDYIYAVPGGEFAYNGGTIMIFYHLGPNGEVIPFTVDQFAAAGQVKLSIFYSLLPVFGNFGISLAILVAHYVEFANALAIAGISEVLVLVLMVVFMVFFTFAIGGVAAPLIRKKKAQKKANIEKEKYIAQYGDQLENEGIFVNRIEFPQRITPTPKITEDETHDTYGVIMNSRDIHYAPVGSSEEEKVYQTPLMDTVSSNISNTIQTTFSKDIEFAPLDGRKQEPVKEVIEVEKVEEEQEIQLEEPVTEVTEVELFVPETYQEKTKVVNETNDEIDDVESVEINVEKETELFVPEIVEEVNEIVEEPKKKTRKPSTKKKTTTTKKKTSTSKTKKESPKKEKTSTKKSNPKKTTKTKDKKTPTKKKVNKKPVAPISAIDEKGKGKEYIIETSSPNNLTQEQNKAEETKRKNKPSALVKRRGEKTTSPTKKPTKPVDVKKKK